MGDWRTTVKPGTLFYLYINQGEREATVLAVRGTVALAEYQMPNGTTSLVFLKLPQDETMEPERVNISYRFLPTVWLEDLAAAGTHWVGRPQQASALPGSPAELLAARKAGKK